MSLIRVFGGGPSLLEQVVFWTIIFYPIVVWSTLIVRFRRHTASFGSTSFLAPLFPVACGLAVAWLKVGTVADAIRLIKARQQFAAAGVAESFRLTMLGILISVLLVGSMYVWMRRRPENPRRGGRFAVWLVTAGFAILVILVFASVVVGYRVASEGSELSLGAGTLHRGAVVCLLFSLTVASAPYLPVDTAPLSRPSAARVQTVMLIGLLIMGVLIYLFQHHFWMVARGI